MASHAMVTLACCFVVLCMVLPSIAVPLATPTPAPTPTPIPTPTPTLNPYVAIPDMGLWGSDDDTYWVPNTTPMNEDTPDSLHMPLTFRISPSPDKDSLITVNVVGILSMAVVIVVVLVVIVVVYCYHTYETTRLAHALQAQAMARRPDYV